jgi:hypothetical protein
MFKLEKENLHHAYLLPSDTSILPSFLKYLESLGFVAPGNPDFFIKQTETFTIDDAREIKSFQSQRAVSGDKKIILIVTEYLSHQSQHALLKVFEEPSPGVHFFLITPVVSVILPTLKSRLFILNREEGDENEELSKRAEKFLKAEKEDRISMVSKIVKEFDKEETSTPLKVYTVSFLNEIEKQVSKKTDKSKFDLEVLWKVKDYIHDQGASVKNLLETLALTF